MSADKLLPCPFCGGEAEIDATGNLDFYGHEHQDVMVTCKSCEAEIYVGVGSGETAAFSCSCCHDVTAEAVKRWNTRAYESEIAELTKQRDELQAALRVARMKSTDEMIVKLIDNALSTQEANK